MKFEYSESRMKPREANILKTLRVFESFLKVLDTFEKLHDLEIRKSRLERISQYEPPPGSPNLELDAKEIADFPGP